jgi:hypothetical protein
MSEKNVNKLVNAIKAATKGDPISAQPLLPVIVSAIAVAEKFTVSGEVRKQLVIEAIEIVLDDTVKDASINSFIKLALPTVIDTAVSLTKKEWDINVIKKSSCFAACFKKQ